LLRRVAHAIVMIATMAKINNVLIFNIKLLT